MIENWLTIVILAWTLVIIPGPNFALTVHNSLLHSRRAGLYTVLGIALGGTTHVLYSLIGISALISQSILLFNTLKWLGTAYLFYLGIKALRATPRQSAAENPKRVSLNSRTAARSGFLTCLLNPKSALFFFALFSQVIQPDTSLPLRAFYGMTIVAIQLMWYSTVALVISRPSIRSMFTSTSHWVERATGVVMVGFGIRLALTGGKAK
jgi:RhtB (resistance to homoserine/threonine) family protein